MIVGQLEHTLWIHVLDASKPWSHEGHGLKAVVLAGVAGQHSTPSNVPLHHLCASSPGHAAVTQSRYSQNYNSRRRRWRRYRTPRCAGNPFFCVALSRGGLNTIKPIKLAYPTHVGRIADAVINQDRSHEFLLGVRPFPFRGNAVSSPTGHKRILTHL